MRTESDLDGPQRGVHSTVGPRPRPTATWKVRGRADLTIGEAGPIRDPAEFQGLRVTLAGA